ncbi:hypothetical protein BTE54_00310 [Agrobacterium sp. YIC 4121]|nr:hypothetical protein BTE54_00310 [Agrobacterium sp. YIC 4121]
MGENVSSAHRHPGPDPGSSAIKSLIAKDSFTAQTRHGWMPDPVRHDVEMLRPVFFEITDG